jgi:cytochrome c-type biogenesis protein CcmH
VIGLILSLVLTQGYAPLRQGQEPLDQVREARVQQIGKKLRCAVCQGVSIADSPASMARAQLDKVRELVTEGKSDQEIFDYFVERYGEWALMEPKKSGVTLGLWLAPVLVLVLGVLLIMSSTKKPVAAVVEQAPANNDDFLAKVRADLEEK